MCAFFQPAWYRATISLRPWTVVRALAWATRTSGRMWAFDKPHPTRRFSLVHASPTSPTSWLGTASPLPRGRRSLRPPQRLLDVDLRTRDVRHGRETSRAVRMVIRRRRDRRLRVGDRAGKVRE